MVNANNGELAEVRDSLFLRSYSSAAPASLHWCCSRYRYQRLYFFWVPALTEAAFVMWHSHSYCFLPAFNSSSWFLLRSFFATGCARYLSSLLSFFAFFVCCAWCTSFSCGLCVPIYSGDAFVQAFTVMGFGLGWFCVGRCSCSQEAAAKGQVWVFVLVLSVMRAWGVTILFWYPELPVPVFAPYEIA
nr:hypothetical protein Iba_chr07cCG0130 [Ipomoea batatas]